MNAVLRIVLVLSLGLVYPAGAANLPLIQGGLPSQAEPAPVAAPEPAELEPNWRVYFDVEGEALARRISETKQRLQTLLTELPKTTATPARTLIKDIATNLEALARARQQPVPKPPAPRPPELRYTVSQLLDLASRLGGEQAELQAERIDTASLERTLEAAQQRVDTLMAAYLRLKENDPNRVQRGLEIMAEGSAVAAAEARLRLAKAALAVHETRVRQLADEQTVAAERLVAEQADLDRLGVEIEQARALLKQAQERSDQERSKALSLLNDDPNNKTQALYRQQRIVHAAVLEAIENVRLLRLLAQRDLVALLLNAADIDTQTMRQRVVEGYNQLAVIQQQAASWTSDSQRERSRASEALAGTAEVPGAPAMFDIARLLHQDRLDLAQKTLVALQSLEAELRHAVLLIQRLEQELAATEGRLRDWLNRGEQALIDVWETATGWMRQSLFKLGDTPLTALGLLRVALILFIAWWISHWWRRALQRLVERREGINQAALYTVGRLSHYVIIVLGLMVGLASIGVDFTNFTLLASAMAIGMGFGLQSIVSNFVSGLILLFERTLKVGDFVELASGLEGEVREINVRSTRINTNDNVDVVVPNSEFINHKVINWTLEENFRRIHVPFRVAYGSDVERVTQAALEAAERVPYTLKTRKAGVWVVDFAENSLDFELVVWITPEGVKRPGAVTAAYKKELVLALYRYGIEVPIPQRDLRLRSGFKEILQPEPAFYRRQNRPKKVIPSGDTTAR